MIYVLFAIVAIFLAYMIIRTDRKREEVEEQGQMPIISNYIVMESEDEDQFHTCVQPLEELSNQYSWFETGHLLCRMDRHGDHFEDTWEGLLTHTNYSKEEEPYYLFFEKADHVVKQSEISWKALVFETSDPEEAKRFVQDYPVAK
ncbi:MULTISPECIES: hypothetical protein [Pontibacillus]|uniref:Uncharacterized protein n=1 Tax=Pontibacillus chungwhensis TaxID=265426 RepID=A0ABY8V005_9BACI|nr:MULTISPECIES: hypothetical protein [Pontibacillus]MCD5325432.1 hypothetical protein [Pontibacillus sp. HN14]WIF98547.1 hypothetical protein QNI29_02435 [Pontibacillus chungwhensis]